MSAWAAVLEQLLALGPAEFETAASAAYGAGKVSGAHGTPIAAGVTPARVTKPPRS